jgi:glyoxylase-like metal-dependent hydrolase (beta-lactamase superfamily II)
MWRAEVLIPAYRVVFALAGGEIVEVRGQSTAGTFRAYRGLPDAVPGMIAWPNTVLLEGPERIVIDPGYQTQGDMLAGALRARGIQPDEIGRVLMTHLHSDHLSALPQLGMVELSVHELELDTPYGRRQRGLLEGVSVTPVSGDEGEFAPGVRWIHTPGHSPGHIAISIDTEDGLAVVAGDTLGPEPGWFLEMELPEDHPEREAHLAAFRRIRALRPAVLIPGHTPPMHLGAG